MIDDRGKLLNFSRYWPIPDVDVSDRDYFKVLSADSNLETFISMPVQNRSSGSWNIYIARRLNGPDGNFIGLLLGAMSQQYFENLFAATALESGHRDCAGARRRRRAGDPSASRRQRHAASGGRTIGPACRRQSPGGRRCRHQQGAAAIRPHAAELSDSGDGGAKRGKRAAELGRHGDPAAGDVGPDGTDHSHRKHCDRAVVEKAGGVRRGRRSSERGEIQLPGDDEPRDPHADERRARPRQQSCSRPSSNPINGRPWSAFTTPATACSKSSTTFSTFPIWRPAGCRFELIPFSPSKVVDHPLNVIGPRAAAKGLTVQTPHRR